MNNLKALEPYIRKLLNKRGFQVIKITKPGRHIISKIKKNNEYFHFKMATNHLANEKILNEFKTDLLLKRRLKKGVISKLKNRYENGYIKIKNNKYFYFIRDYIEGDDLTLPTKKSIKEAAQLAFKISKIKTIKLVIKKNFNFEKNLFRPVASWSRQVNLDSKKPLKILLKARDNFSTTYNHGDFTPWHIFKLKNKLETIDSEHAGENYKYYDVANFYVRLHQNIGNKKYANIFLREFIKLIPLKDQVRFWEDFKPILIERTIGHLWEIHTKHPLGIGKNSKSCKNLLKNILEKNSTVLN